MLLGGAIDTNRPGGLWGLSDAEGQRTVNKGDLIRRDAPTV